MRSMATGKIPESYTASDELHRCQRLPKSMCPVTAIQRRDGRDTLVAIFRTVAQLPPRESSEVQTRSRALEFPWTPDWGKMPVAGGVHDYAESH